MTKDIDRQLSRAPVLEEGPSLGRVFSVLRETWRLDEDPQEVSPRTEVLAARKTALEAADLARKAARDFERHGFHKPSGAWWGSDGVRLHRFAIRSRRRRGHGALLGSAAAALGAILALAVVGRAHARRRKASSRA